MGLMRFGLKKNHTSTLGQAIHIAFRRSSTSVRKPSYFHNPGKEPLRQLTVGQLLDNAATTWPDRLAIVSVEENQQLTFLEAKQQIDKLGAGFIELGLKPGDRIGLVGPNTIQWYTTLLAAKKAGLIVVNINPAFMRKELKYCLESVEAKAVVVQESFKTHNFYNDLCTIAPEIGHSETCTTFKTKRLPYLTQLVVMGDRKLPGAFDSATVSSMASPQAISKLEELSSELQADDPCNIQFSSGTTGKPKAAVLSHFSIVNNSYFFGWRLGYHEKHHTLCLQVPFFHTFGTVLGILASLNHGTTLVLPSSSFKVGSTIEALKKVRCSILYGTPTMYVDLCAQIKERVKDDSELDAAVRGFDTIVSGGALCSPSLFKAISENLHCTNVASAYGMTESSPITFVSSRNDTFEQRTTTVGCVAEHTEIKVVDPQGRTVPMGSTGEVWFRGYSVMLGYWNNPEATTNAITQDRWLKSGDLFVLDENGYGHVVGRLKDVIIRGGENIFPSEIEDHLVTHPDILEAHVYGVADDRMGEEVAVSIRLASGKKMTPEDVKAFCKDSVSHYKIPKYIWFVTDFPKTESGKIKKFVLREEAERQLKARRGA